MKLSSPKTIKEVQKLTGKITSLNRFIARSADRNMSFFKKEDAVISVLVKESEGGQSLVYYVSRMLQGVEKRNIQIEKLVLALLTTMRKLRPYFQWHPIVVLTNHPLKQVMSKLDVSGRMVKWAVELRKFDIEFQTRTAIKAQVFADFLVELTGEQQ
ncbi:UNVERIFIED_CONTAM: hypothetical protein Slati_3520900 [Sesamum latifolium]|uniref:Reverse transcriptase RNase H-like domain-containing protein n=1 Tax=Sesamum latifolium TaxID=2727402 RepID=A0AAW2UHN2_9LAMI